jgi:hypothetical protein
VRLSLHRILTPDRFPGHGKLYDPKFPSAPLSSSSPFLSVALTVIPCSSIGFSLPTELSFSTLRCGSASIGYQSDPSYFSLPEFDWNGTALFTSGQSSLLDLPLRLLTGTQTEENDSLIQWWHLNRL